MQWFLPIVAALGISQTAGAQKWADAPQYHFGVRAGAASSVPLASNWDGSGEYPLWSPVLGVSVDTRVAKLPFYIESGLYYIDRGYKVKEDHVEIATEHNHSILIPALISYHAYTSTQVSVQPFTGPYLAYGFGDTEADYGWRVGCGVNVKQFYANIGFDLGLRDNFHSHEGNVSSFFVTLGWNILGER